MATISCPHCGHRNAVTRRSCDSCLRALPADPPAAAWPQRYSLLNGVAEFITYAGAHPSGVRFDVDGFLADLRRLKPELKGLALPEGLSGLTPPRFQSSAPALELPDLPDFDLSLVLSYLANLRLPQLELQPALDFLAGLRLPRVDLPALGELLAGLDLAAVHLPALADLLPRIDLAAVDPALLSDLLAGIDLSAVDPSALAAAIAEIDWASLGELPAEIDLAELLGGLDLG